ncbi:bifunctional tetrahydrofolate synthase/dihydrofolate synthase [Dyella sp. M7H15-1]|uniref:bifunctional tetrahydrofolate synthase/dihydrofolate synthase n=1 Tax=Dyella sp. M7H15-1 TaxID=2501295 RepID=UPI001005109D|nr:bifunctional tetrahydrofolate synthase/dihydrofolate synthase [Dyella sp. M7H15-1]QAU23216.1 bifunctional tetrahydrofolate synthase/dihydrofolate synthase [Dyella sp. M7H15-1]
MKPRTLADWLDYQQRIHVLSVDLGLDRVRTVWQRMGAPALARRVVTVGGTNGKGSTVAFLEAMLTAAGQRAGCYTSPHLIRYNERIRIAGADADDAALIESFERIELVRGEIFLTYFEFGTLAAFDLFARANLDVAVLEVGLGGRLDVVNLIDADAVIITTVDLDHVEWLGPDRDSIGREKAGIARRDRPAIIGELDPPHGLLEALSLCGAHVERAGREFWVQRSVHRWQWRHQDGTSLSLPDPELAAPVQYANAASAIAALHALHIFDPTELERIAAAGMHQPRAPARLQSLGGDPVLIVDVGHNPQAARALADWLDATQGGRVHAVYGALSDKDVGGVMAALGSRITHWHLAGLERDTPRGLPASVLAGVLHQVLPRAAYDIHRDVRHALAAARAGAWHGERILAFGSFFVAAAVLQETTG